MRRPTPPGIPALFLLLVLASGAAALADRILAETGRELLGPDGRTLVDKEHGYSIVLPASDWKVYLNRYEPLPDDTGFQLLLAPPDGEVRVRIHEKIHPVPMSLEILRKILVQDPQARNARAEIVDAAGMKCLEYEAETQGAKVWYHGLHRICEGKSGRKLVMETSPASIPVERWPAEEKVIRELIGSFRRLP